MKIKIFSVLVGMVAFAMGFMFVAALQLFLSLFSAPVATTSNYESIQPSGRGELQATELPGKVELSCYDPTILPIWSELKRDPTFQQELSRFSGEHSCSDLIEVTLIDLDGDGAAEFFARGKNLMLCGATANCYMWVLGGRNGRMTVLLDSGGIRLERKRARTEGYSDLVLRHNGGNYPDSLLEYRYKTGKYRLARCFQQDKFTLEKTEESCEGW